MGAVRAPWGCRRQRGKRQHTPSPKNTKRPITHDVYRHTIRTGRGVCMFVPFSQPPIPLGVGYARAVPQAADTTDPRFTGYNQGNLT